jgi:transglutaminase-like putative cysteine protease
MDVEQGAEAVPQGRAWRSPEEWLSVFALAVMLLVIALAVDDAHWAGYRPGGESQTAFLATVVLAAGACGFVLAHVRWPSALAHLVGAIIGAGTVIVLVAGVVSSDPSLPIRLVDLDRSLAIFLHDIIVRQVRSDQTSAFLLLIGVLTWASGYFAAFAVFRRHRPVSAIVLLGLLLIVSMSLTLKNQLPYLVVFSTASLVLLVRMSLSHQRVLRAHGRLGDAATATRLYLRNGAVFIGVALASSLVLTANASSAPLYGLWQDANDQIIELGFQLDRYLGGISGPARGPGGLFTSSQTIRGVWEGSQVVVFAATASDGDGYYWRAATYDEFDGRSWKQTDRVSGRTVAAGEPLLEGTADAVEPGAGRRSVTFTITPAAWVGDTLLAPQTPYSVSLSAQPVTVGPGGPFASLRATSPIREGQPFTLKALVPDEGPDGLTASQLAAAGTVYPAWASRYAQILPGSMGPLAKETADRVVSGLPADQRDPYHVARALQDFLYKGGGFTYDTDVSDVCPGGSANIVDCFLTQRRGYCEYFATALTMMLRTQQIPARYAVGYLPGRPLTTGVFTVERSAAHAWVEVYFPRLGWVRFDPTPGNSENGQARTALPAGSPVPTPTPVPGASASPITGPVFSDEFNGPDDPGRPSSGGADGGGVGGGGLLANPLVSGALAVAAVALVALVWRSRRRRDWFPTAEGAWAGVVGLASRFGYAPRPSQTVYEYVDMLEGALPEVRPELRQVAVARVEAKYGRREPSGAGLDALRRAYLRVRRYLFLLLLPTRRGR